MCGIAGIILKGHSDKAYIENVVDLLQRSIEHRGPDAVGMHIEEARGFVNRRLAIVGISGGNQPIYSPSKNQGIVYNGEVYNYLSLRDKLVKKGYSFHTNTDTEVVLNSFIESGEDAFSTFEGMFGICVWDNEQDVTYIVRDGFGMKPMYVYEDSKQIIYSSELSALIKVPNLDLSLDEAGIKDYLTFRYVNAPLTIYKRIRRLYPGSYLKLQNGKVTEHIFKDITDMQSDSLIETFDEAKSLVHDTLLESLKKHLIGEVPIALLLSGGVDSSILAALLSEADTKMTCFNIGFDSVNEFEYSSAVADMYGFELNNVQLTSKDIFNSFEEIILALDEPIADPACFPLHLLCKEIKKSATVVLSGEGADELFAGYPQYRNFRSPMSTPKKLTDFLNNSYYFLDAEALLKKNSVNGGWQRTIKYFGGQQSFSCMSNYDFKTWVPDNLMMKADKIAMRSSLEGRFPFLDYSMIELVRRIPDEFMLSEQGETKHVLKQAFYDRLPEKIINRPKMGFTVPVPELIKEFSSLYQQALIKLRKHEINDIVDIDLMESQLSSFLNGNEGLALRNWTNFVLMTWLADRAG
ncbi:MAG: asparagine synthase (glutamine-hydrolyzing) [Bacteroidota bacterium]